jgi:hypothetical protein
LVKTLDVNYSQEVQYDEYDSNNEQCMNPTASLRHSWADVPTEKAKQPQDDKNYDNGPQHEVSPLNNLPLLR